MSKLILALAATLAAGFAAPPASAAPAPQVRIVSAAGLDLESSAGRATLERRIAAAARAVCGQVSPIDLRSRADVRACRADTFAQAAASIR